MNKNEMTNGSYASMISLNKLSISIEYYIVLEPMMALINQKVMHNIGINATI